MNKELKQKWVAALRSGEYKQGKGKLLYHENGETSYCCLGVLCEVAKFDPAIWHRKNILGECFVSGSTANSLRENLNISITAEHTLVCLNDGGENGVYRAQPFSVIAGWIEENIHEED